MNWLADQKTLAMQKRLDVSTNGWNIDERTSRVLFDSLLNGVAYGRMIYDGGEPVDFCFLSVNEAFARQTGLAGVAGRRVSEVIPGVRETDAELLTIFGLVAADGRPERFEHYLAALQMWVSVSVSCPQPGHFLAVFDVITERKQAEASLLESEHRLTRVIDGSDQGFWDWNLRTNTFTVSPRFETMLGYQPGETAIKVENWASYVHPDDLEKAWASIKRHLAGESPVHEMELRCREKSGKWRWILTCGRIVERDADGKPAMMSGTHTDISERKKAERELRQAAAVFENTQEGVMITDSRARIQSVNRAFTHITGYSLEEIRGRTPALLRSGRHDDAYFDEIRASLANSGYWQGELWNRRKNGETYPQLTTINIVREDAGTALHYVTVFTDVSAIKASQEHLEFVAQHDPLTGLPNRVMLFSRLEHAMSVARRERKGIALLLIDLDRFKDINDSYGHLAGDQLLQQVAETLQGRLRGADTLARLGGDEFAILIEEISRPDDAGRVAEDILAVLEEPWRLINGKDVHVSASIGIALHPGPSSTPEELLQQADAAMYRAKKEGRSRFQYFSEDLTHNARERLDLESRLHRAIEDDELEVYFQPQIDIRRGKVIGAEALVRWPSPDGCLITPDRFIPLAEETGLILPLGQWVLDTVCVTLAEWADRPEMADLTIAVNVSARQFHHPDFVDHVFSTLARTLANPERLKLELTESMLVENVQEVIERMRALKDRGISFSLDDFGTGYSSLSYLKLLPLEQLKIDQSFVRDILVDPNDAAIAKTIIALAESLGLQSDFLARAGCHAYQGYFFSRPLPVQEFENRVRAIIAEQPCLVGEK